MIALRCSVSSSSRARVTTSPATLVSTFLIRSMVAPLSENHCLTALKSESSRPVCCLSLPSTIALDLVSSARYTFSSCMALTRSWPLSGLASTPKSASYSCMREREAMNFSSSCALISGRA